MRARIRFRRQCVQAMNPVVALMVMLVWAVVSE